MQFSSNTPLPYRLWMYRICRRFICLIFCSRKLQKEEKKYTPHRPIKRRKTPRSQAGQRVREQCGSTSYSASPEGTTFVRASVTTHLCHPVKENTASWCAADLKPWADAGGRTQWRSTRVSPPAAPRSVSGRSSAGIPLVPRRWASQSRRVMLVAVVELWRQECRKNTTSCTTLSPTGPAVFSRVSFEEESPTFESVCASSLSRSADDSLWSRRAVLRNFEKFSICLCIFPSISFRNVYN